MADNSTLPVNVGTEVFANDDISSVKYPRVKVTWGPDGTANDTDVATGKPLPIQIRSSTGTAADFGTGAGGSGTIRVTMDSNQLTTLSSAAAAMSGGYQLVGLASDSPGLGSSGNGMRVINGGAEYETVAASQTGQALGAAGATGDYIAGVLVIPATTTPGVVTLLDNAISIPLFVGGASSVSNLVPFYIPLGMISVSGAWKLTTGANVSSIGIGNFT